MAFTPGSVDNVGDGIVRLQAIRANLAKNILAIGTDEGDDNTLTAAERDAVRARWTAQVDTIRAQIKAAVATW